MIFDGDCVEIGGIKFGRETEVLGEKLPSATLSTTNPTLDRGLNPGRRGGKPATNRLSYGAAISQTRYNSYSNYVYIYISQRTIDH
jgi:hypothetical protein